MTLRSFLFLFFCWLHLGVLAQDTAAPSVKSGDTNGRAEGKQKMPQLPADTMQVRPRQSEQPAMPAAAQSDSVRMVNDVELAAAHGDIGKVIRQNRFINPDGTPQFFVNEIRTWKNGREIFFYVMCVLLLILGIFKTFYSHYFSTLFSVYFNTSLRQTQLSEQLFQAKLPSFILNIYFVLLMGAFVWLTLMKTGNVGTGSPYLLLQVCLIAIASIYLIKFCFLKFLGWMSGMPEITNHYIFIIFLVNKLLAIVLIPFIILIAFGKQEWLNIYITLALLCVGVLLLSRYIKSYGLLRQKFPMTVFHFILFITGAELLPLFLLYKIVLDYLIA